MGVIQQVINGIVIGSVFGLFALGLTLVYGVQNVLNLAYGGVFASGALATYYLVAVRHLPVPLAFLGAVIIGALLSAAIELVAVRRLQLRHASEFTVMLATIGASLIVLTSLQKLSDGVVHSYSNDVIGGGLSFAHLHIAYDQLAIVGVSVLAFILVALLVSRTPFGRSMRAVSQSPRACHLLGINVKSVYTLTFALSGALAGFAGALIGVSEGSVYYSMGDNYLLMGLVILTVGGVGRTSGALIVGIGLGIIQALATAYVSSALSDAIAFLILFVVLVVRPTGLFRAGSARKVAS